MSRLNAVTFADGAVDRAAHRRSDPELIRRLLADPATRVIELVGDEFTVTGRHDLAVRAPAPDDADAELVVFLGEVATTEGSAHAGASTAYLLVVPSSAAPSPHRGQAGRAGLRDLAGALDPDTAALVATSLGLANWHRSHQRCSRCGAPTEPVLAGWIRRCPEDGSDHYPRTDIAVIMAVTDDADRLLLGRAPAWPPGRMSVLAGFVEPGETLEQAVAREVREEVGIEVRDVEYVADQPWPFPSSLMIGFTARAVQTDLVLDRVEIVEARWVSRDDVRDLIARGEYRPSPGFSISRALVEDWFGGPLPSVPVS
ncbi:NAD(+) diphosphatase [Nostocoides sp. F2B08]|uniref:NAD(+) diphosphatase n=1 Tax=Nostocoides sp. F2B08 TaxID=2653936 RepID=UPI0012636E54|nr:NAD(+) diphosphatase [Tetrasphaera sp. F2B08]KAB7746214.1 NAD(+) diphosphatase [Tetrasphaera sp. F2B08]